MKRLPRYACIPPNVVDDDKQQRQHRCLQRDANGMSLHRCFEPRTNKQPKLQPKDLPQHLKHN